MMKNCSPKLLLCQTTEQRDQIASVWSDGPETRLLEEVFSGPGETEGKVQLQPGDPLTIIYTSGTSGEPKGVVLTVDNLGFMLQATGENLDDMRD